MSPNASIRPIPCHRFSGSGPATRALVRARAREVALLAGVVPPQVMQVHYEQAKREVTGESEPERQEAILDAAFRRGVD
jgi:hypothetical protein